MFDILIITSVLASKVRQEITSWRDVESSCILHAFLRSYFIIRLSVLFAISLWPFFTIRPFSSLQETGPGFWLPASMKVVDLLSCIQIPSSVQLFIPRSSIYISSWVQFSIPTKIIHSDTVFSPVLYTEIIHSDIVFSSVFYIEIIHLCIVFSSILYNEIIHSNIAFSPVFYTQIIHLYIFFSPILYTEIIHSECSDPQITFITNHYLLPFRLQFLIFTSICESSKYSNPQTNLS